MAGSTACRPLTASQHEDPQPPTTSTALPATGAVAGAAGAAGPAARPARAPDSTVALGAGLIGSWIVPVNSNRAVPTTRASTMTAAIGANGRLNTSFAGTDSCARDCSRAANTASPYHALA